MKFTSKVLQIVLELPKMLKMVEDLLPESGKGKEKLALVRGLLEDVFGNLADSWPAIEKAIARIVKFFNTVGVFKK